MSRLRAFHDGRVCIPDGPLDVPCYSVTLSERRDAYRRAHPSGALAHSHPRLCMYAPRSELDSLNVNVAAAIVLERVFSANRSS